MLLLLPDKQRPTISEPIYKRTATGFVRRIGNIARSAACKGPRPLSRTRCLPVSAGLSLQIPQGSLKADTRNT